MADIIEVDFKNKRKIVTNTVEAYKCSMCQSVYQYDSRVHDESYKMPHIEAAVGKNNTTVRICKLCVDEMHTLLN